MIAFNSLEAISIGPINIFTHGLFMAIGVMSAYLLFRKEAEKKDVSPDRMDSMLYASVFGGLLGARLFYVVLNWHLYSSFLDIFKIWEGGLVSFGGLAGGIAGAFLYLKLKNFSYWNIADLAAPYILLGWGIGRIGDFLSWSEIGTTSNLPWAFSVNGDIPRHPAQLYSSIILIFLFVIIQYYFKKKYILETGLTFGATLLSYGLFRFLIEFVRDYPSSEYLFSYRSFAQIASAVLVSIGISIIIFARKKNHENSTA